MYFTQKHPLCPWCRNKVWSLLAGVSLHRLSCISSHWGLSCPSVNFKVNIMSIYWCCLSVWTHSLFVVRLYSMWVFSSCSSSSSSRCVWPLVLPRFCLGCLTPGHFLAKCPLLRQLWQIASMNRHSAGTWFSPHQKHPAIDDDWRSVNANWTLCTGSSTPKCCNLATSFTAVSIAVANWIALFSVSFHPVLTINVSVHDRR